ncbi:hypothetical protein EXIGLDRAFT_409503 [Exidia glandulosa HHB12029]|uniref:Uncharacterized protein n=1 Tax=Exidia glandulosa HHB12029 TaxID=1314781 RepID=A0A165BGV5_EXIGL|nr:hypothetical protein EXIGLDRAFT_409503 [Exidia glandulosa HHB12029]
MSTPGSVHYSSTPSSSTSLQRDAFYGFAASKPASYYAPTRHFLQRGFFDYEPPLLAVLAALAAVQTFTLDSAALDTLALAEVFSPERLFLLSFTTGRGTWLNNAHAFKNLTSPRTRARRLAQHRRGRTASYPRLHRMQRALASARHAASFPKYAALSISQIANSLLSAGICIMKDLLWSGRRSWDCCAQT